MCTTTTSNTTNSTTMMAASTGPCTGSYDPDRLPPGHAEVHAALRYEARGGFHMEAVTELLIRSCGGVLADRCQPWIGFVDYTDSSLYRPCEPWELAQGAWIEAGKLREAAIAGKCDRMQDTILVVAASLLEEGGEQPPLFTGGALLDAIVRLDREHLDLVLAAITHAAGPFNAIRAPGIPVPGEVLPSLHPWPAPDESSPWPKHPWC